MTISNTRAAYRVLDPAGFFSDDDSLYQEGDEIYFDGEPNEQLEPLNELARERITAYLNKLDEYARQVAEKNGRPYVGRPRNLDGAIALATQDERNRMSLMGNKEKATSTERVSASQTPEVGNANPAQKRGRGRPRKDLITSAA